MGKKNKYKKDPAPDDKSSESGPRQQVSQQQGGGQQQQRSGQQQGGGQQQQKPAQQQGGGQQQQRPDQQQGAGQQQQRPAQQQGGGQQQQRPGQQQSGGQQQQRPGQQQGGGQQQQRPAQQQGGGQQQQRPGQQQGGGQQQQRAGQQQGGGQQQQRPGQQQQSNRGAGGDYRGQQTPKQGAWGGGQNQGQRGAGGDSQQQQQAPQQGAWGGAQKQQQSQRGAGGSGQQVQPSQQGAWGGKQQQFQRGNEGEGQRQQGPRGQPQQQSQQGAWDDRQRQQQPQRAVGGDGQRQQGARAGGQHQQGGGYQQQQQSRNIPHKMAQLSISSESVVPTKSTSCNGIVRGTLGKPGTVEVNYLKLDLSNMPGEAYHYDVTIDPERPKKFLRPAFEQCRLEMFPNIQAAFDGMKSCYTLQRLPTPISCTIQVPDSGNRNKEFKVQIKETDTSVVDLNSLRSYQTERVFDKPMRALQVLEVVLASNNHKLGIRVGRSFFRKPDRPFDLQDGFEAWTGLYQAALLGEEPLLNVDIAHKSFPSETTLINYLKKQNIDLQQPLGNRDFPRVNGFLKDLNILYTPPTSFGSYPRTYKVNDIGTPAISTKFKTEDGKEQTVANYYSSRGYKLQYPQLNCLKVGSSVKSISLPMELCSIPAGQALNRKDKDQQVRNMIRFAATSTNVRKEKIMDLLRYFNHNGSDSIREFGLTIGQNFIKVPMRLLPKPYMEYLQGKTITTTKGAWRMDGMQFLATSKPPDGHKWAILYENGKCRRSHHDLEDFKKTLFNTSRTLNMGLQSNAEIIGFTARDVQVKFKELSAQKFDLVFVVLSDFGTPYYKIKQIAELEVGVLTQCIKENTLFRKSRDMTVYSNILLKVNGKLNGTNHKIAAERDSNLKSLMAPIENVMYLGADVTHPSPDQKKIPSVVGVAASHDKFGACYNCQYRLQEPTKECIEDMESIVMKHLETYNRYQRKFPSKIIYYRDGVSDGQFPEIKRVEIRCIQSACKKMGCNPKLTCIIVVKRHHTRFFPLTAPFNERDFNNVEPGSVVDQHITHPNEVQFFMVSHQSIQGTAKPTRYNVIMDESKFDINLLQMLTYNLCHLFPRCNRVVSYPAPAYLAHLVAFRGRVYIDGQRELDNRNYKREYERRLIRPEFLIRNPMYFI